VRLRTESPGHRPPPAAHALLALAVRAAEAGGQIITGHLGRAEALAWKSSGSDPVTDVDRRGEARIMSLLTAERSADGILSEESPELPGESGLRWVVDALDGSVNHLYGIPQCAVSIAVEEHRDDGWAALAGVVHDPIRSETFSAVRDGGAALNGVPVRVNDPVPLSQALVATEFAYTADSRRRQATAVSRVLPRARDIRSTGSSALDLCWTATGRFDAFYEDELERWDWAAGRLIVEEAGGVATPIGRGVLAAGPALHRELAALDLF
jgi:myo-inositol-1(or 4)-monophosphatase